MIRTDFAEMTERFLEFEEEMALLERTVDGVYFWERVRLQIHKRLYTALGISEGIVNDAYGTRDYLSAGLLASKNLLARNPFFSSQADLMFFGTGRRKRLGDDRHWDLHIDPLVEEVDTDYVCLERPSHLSHATPAKTDHLRYTDFIDLSATGLQRLGISSSGISADERSSLQKIETAIENEFGIAIPFQRLVEADLAQRRVRLPLYRRLVDRIDPSIAFVTVPYDGRETIVEACQSRNVPVVDLQHGTITKYHMGYHFPHGNRHVFPDYFFSFGEYWADSVDLPLPRENIYSIGFAHLERQSARYEGVESQDQVLFISQPEIAGDLSDLAVELDERPDFEGDIVYTLHPKEYDVWRERYPALARSDVAVVKDDPPLYELMASSSAQVGVYSTAVFEGLYFGLNTYVFEAPGVEYMEFLIEEGYAYLIRSVDDFLEACSDIPPAEEWDRSYFFEPDPVRQFERAMADIRSQEARPIANTKE